jgi:hypothetical protein
MMKRAVFCILLFGLVITGTFCQELIAAPKGQLNRNIANLAREGGIPLYVVDTILTDIVMLQDDYLLRGRIGRWGLTRALLVTPTSINPNDEQASAIRALAYIGSLYDRYEDWAITVAYYLGVDVQTASSKIMLVQMLRGER